MPCHVISRRLSCDVDVVGVAAMMWQMFVNKKLSAAAFLMEKVIRNRSSLIIII